MVNTKIRLIILFSAENGEALYSQQKQDQDLTVAQNMNFRLKLKKVGKTTQRRQWHPTPICLPGKFHGLRSLVGYNPWGCTELDTNEQLSTHIFFSIMFYYIVLNIVSCAIQ